MFNDLNYASPQTYHSDTILWILTTPHRDVARILTYYSVADGILERDRRIVTSIEKDFWMWGQ